MNGPTILIRTRDYWTWRADGYSEVNREELRTRQHCVWQDTLMDELSRRFPLRDPATVQVLDIGCGPGFFSIVLAEAGYAVTAVDLTPRMLEEAKRNAGDLADQIRFLEMNAEELAFPDGSFDAVVTRNLTWNLPHPEQAYREWVRILRPGGMMMIFDANWYRYLYDDQALRAYREDRVRSESLGIDDENRGKGFKVMEQIAREIPLSRIRRPAWDRQVLEGLHLEVSVNERIWDRVWSEQERINFASTPMFMICARKP